MSQVKINLDDSNPSNEEFNAPLIAREKYNLSIQGIDTIGPGIQFIHRLPSKTLYLRDLSTNRGENPYRIHLSQKNSFSKFRFCFLFLPGRKDTVSVFFWTLGIDLKDSVDGFFFLSSII